MDTLIRERDGKDEVWYSEEYVKNQIEIAYRNGIRRGIEVNFHTATPTNTDMVNDLIIEFKRRLEEEYQKDFANGLVFKFK